MLQLTANHQSAQLVSPHQMDVHTTRPTHHVHDGEDVRLHVLASMVVHEFGVGHHQGLHPSLLADGAARDPSRGGLSGRLTSLLMFPGLPLLLHLERVVSTICPRKRTLLGHDTRGYQVYSIWVLIQKI